MGLTKKKLPPFPPQGACPPHSTAVNSTCDCTEGFAGTGICNVNECDLECEDIDECNSNKHNCHQNAMCRNSIGSFNCYCNSGQGSHNIL